MNNFAVIGIKQETTSGTAVDIADSDLNLRIYDVEVSPNLEFAEENPQYLTGDYASDEAVPGKQTAEISGAVRYRWSGTVDTEPAVAKILKLGNMHKNAYTTVGIGYQDTPSGTDNATYTIQYLIPKSGSGTDAWSIKLAGCKANAMSLAGENVGAPIMLNFTAVGKVVEVKDVANADIPTLNESNLDSAMPERLIDAPATVVGESVKIGSFELDFGLTATPIDNQGDSTGIDYYEITAKEPVLSCDPYTSLIADRTGNGLYSDAATPTLGETKLTFGDASNDHLVIYSPNSQAMSPAIQDKEGLTAWDLSVRFRRNGQTSSNIPSNASFELLQGART